MEVEEWQLEVYHDTLEESAILDAEGGVATGQIPEIALPEDERSYGKRRESVVEAPGAEADIQDLEESLQAREEDLRKQLEAVRQRREAIRQRGSVVGRRVPGLRQQLLASSTERELWEQKFGMTTQELEPQDSEMEVESDVLSLSSQYTVRSVVSYKERVNRRPVPRDRFTDFPTME
ncbi:hypothetical protein B0F90DRAFT_1035249 [Multifurca ochricompacta]|uniref:Uncharacterized protein n=1 Tax=Multifurca ochricompacta TaxID=376703 RepID=A0AAD4LZM9_9AGAM|nr:hypothetical protein B0F90DRAFT_1035249 [Multifurca ochricompacta]